MKQPLVMEYLKKHPYAKLTDIAKECGCSLGYVSYIKKNVFNSILDDQFRLKAALDSGMDAVDIACQEKCSYRRVRKAIEAFDLMSEE